MSKRAPVKPGDYSVGFLRLTPGKIHVLGSGTLVRSGNLHGIITAAHVWRAVRKLEVVGFYQYPVRRGEIQSAKERTSFLSDVTIGEQEDELGPDIAFIRLPPPTAAQLAVHSSFLIGAWGVLRVRSGEPKRPDWLAGDAVPIAPGSGPQFPANREFNRDFRRQTTISGEPPQGHAQFRCLSPRVP